MTDVQVFPYSARNPLSFSKSDSTGRKSAFHTVYTLLKLLMSQRKFACLFAVLIFLGLGAIQSVSAGNTSGVINSGTETFTTTQTDGINVNDGTIFTVNVNNLTGPITPSAGTNGIR